MLGIKLDRNGEQPLKRQIYHQLKEQMLCGRMKAGEALPSTRELARELDVSRNTVGEAYEMLIAEGYAVNRQGAATRVAEGLFMERVKSLIVPHDSTLEKPAIQADFRTGRPDLRQFPYFSWRQLIHEASIELPEEFYGYTGPQGLAVLREEIAAWLYRSRGLAVSPSDIFVTAGATHALHMLAELLCGEGKKVLIEDPCHSGMLKAFQNNGCTVEPVAVDDRGLITQRLPEGKDVCAVYTTPSHQFPLGGILPAARRADLVYFARKYGLYIIEDDYDSEFRYCGEPIAPMYAMDSQNVIYVGTFSKSLFPAIRIGYVILPQPLHKQWHRLRTYTDVQNPVLEQEGLALFLKTRKLDRHVQKMRRIYGLRRQVLMDALKDSFGTMWLPCGDAAGLHTAIEFPGRFFDEEFRRQCLQKGIAVNPVESYCLEKERHQSKLLFGYGHLEPEEIRRGILLLRDYLKKS